MYFEIFIALNFTGMEFHYLGSSNVLLVPKGCTATTDIRVKKSPLTETVWSMHLAGANFIGQRNKEDSVLLEMLYFRSR